MRLSIGALALLWSGACSSPPVEPSPTEDGSGTNPAQAPSGTPPTSTSPVTPTGVCPEGVAFQELSGKAALQVTINGKGPYTFILDTGAPTSGIDDTIASEVGAAPFEMNFAESKVTLSKLAASDIKAALRLDKVVGILGRDTWGQYALTLDYPRNRVWLREKHDEQELAACSHLRQKPSRAPYVLSSYFYVKGRMEDVDGWFLVDSGASLGATLETVFATLQQRRPRTALQGFYTPAAIGTFWAQLAAVASYEVAGQRVTGLYTRTVPNSVLDTLPRSLRSNGDIMLGVLPSGYLKQFAITLDTATSEMRFDAAKESTLTESRHWDAYGFGFEATLEGARIAQIVPGSSAEQNGLKVGDEVVEIEGQAVSKIDGYSRAWYLVTTTKTAPLTLTYKRAEKQTTVTLSASDLLSPPAFK